MAMTSTIDSASKKIRRHRANLFSLQQEQELVKILETYLKENQAPKNILPIQRLITLFCQKSNVNLKNSKAISVKKAYALLNKHHSLQELYWPEKKKATTTKERCYENSLLDRPESLLTQPQSSKELLRENISPILRSKKEESVQPNGLEEKIDRLSEKIISLEQLVQRLVQVVLSSQQLQQQTNSVPQSPALFGGKTSYIVTPIFRSNPFIIPQTKTEKGSGLILQNKDGETKIEDV